MNKHLMIDLETLNTTADAKVLSIGAVLFNAEGTMLNTFYRVLDLDEQQTRSMSHDTLHWWLQQSDEARNAFTNPTVHRHKPINTLTALMQMVSSNKNLYVWSNGADFDLPIISHMCRQYDVKVAWPFWNHRCYRTVKALNKDVPASPREGVYHNALDDAKYQAQHLIEIHRAKGGIL